MAKSNAKTRSTKSKAPGKAGNHAAKSHSARAATGGGSKAAGGAARAAKPDVPATTATVTMDRRSGGSRRKLSDRRQQHEPVAVERRKIQRRAKVARRRQIDPTTCERDYTPDEIEFMSALDEYKRTSGRMFPTCSEVLEVLRKLGYHKPPQAAGSPHAPPHVSQGDAMSQTAV